MITIRGEGLTIADIAAVAGGAKVKLTDDPDVVRRIHESVDYLNRAVESGEQIYGVTTLFGGMADHIVPKDQVAELQASVMGNLKASTGNRLSSADVRASMLLRANSLMHGISALRLEVLQRFETFLNAGATPHVFEVGSIGASGDLVPLAYVAGAILGLGPKYLIDMGGETLDGTTALTRLGLKPIMPGAKEGLALVNGTSVSAGIAANCVYRAEGQLAIAMAAHAMLIQALLGTDQSFHPFVHAHKPHAGQVWTAREMLGLLKGGRMILDESGGNRSHREGHLIQDRYSLRCLPQFFGPIVDGIAQVARQIEVEANSATDNPLIDVPNKTVFHCGNFLGQYVGVAMDQLRYFIGLMAKHLDIQIALTVSPEFNFGLAPSLVGNEKRPINVGFKSLQLVCNSLMPLLTFHGNSIADRFPTHAEQFNQNINSQSLNSATLARRSADLFDHYLANALLFASQAAELRAFKLDGSYDPRKMLSPPTAKVYEAVYAALGRKPSKDRPIMFDDTDYYFEDLAAALIADLSGRNGVLKALAPLVKSVEAHCRG
jgi:phenylalanine ammonia-lyase